MGWHGVLVSNMGAHYHFEIHGDEQMATQSNIHFFTNWAKEQSPADDPRRIMVQKLFADEKAKEAAGAEIRRSK
jgi:hypothetical protein